MDMYSEPNKALSHWYPLFKSVLDSHAPLKKRRVKKEFTSEWLTVKFKPLSQRGIIFIERGLRQTMHLIGVSTVLRVIEWFILFVTLSAYSTETQLTIILKILKTSGALFVILHPRNVLNYQII